MEKQIPDYSMGKARPQKVVTSSRLYAWWLLKTAGYIVGQRSRTPQSGFLGRIRYVDKWVLLQKDPPSLT